MAHLVSFRVAHKAVMAGMGFNNKTLERLHISFYWNRRGLQFCKWNRIGTPTVVLDDADFMATKLRLAGEWGIHCAEVDDVELDFVRAVNDEWRTTCSTGGYRNPKPTNHRQVRKLICARMQKL